LLPKWKCVPLCKQFFHVLSKAEGGRLHLSIAITSTHPIAHSNTHSAAYSFTRSFADSFSNSHASDSITDTHPLSIACLQRW
jgi:hypothetical protein